MNDNLNGNKLNNSAQIDDNSQINDGKQTDKRIILMKKNIKKLMREETPRVTQGEIAELLNIAQSNVSRLLSEKEPNTFFSVLQLITIADFFDVSLDELAGRDYPSTEDINELIGLVYETAWKDYEKIMRERLLKQLTGGIRLEYTGKRKRSHRPDK